ncbi:MAG: hypothetical protein EOO48_03265 [Flavobacterium sp.]|nr:MAG: hypothetical protein EOO48_03265 [Flavobacterium sp.]
MLTKNLSVPNKAWRWIAVIWTLIIAVLCMVRFTDLPDVGVKGTDKYVHATFHFFFTIFWCQHLINTKSRPLRPTLLRVLLLSIVYGGLIEIAQETLTTTRHADWADVAANFTGAILAVLVLTIFHWRKEKSPQ